jgi:ribonuclease R
VGRKFHKRYQLGDELTVKVARANLDKKQLDFILA